MGIWTTIKGYLTAILTGLIALLSAFAFYQKYKADSKEEEIDELENQIQANDINHEIKNFEAINRERKDIADEKLNKELDDLNIKLNGTYDI